MMLLTWKFWRAALIRAIRTAAEAALAYIGAAARLEAVDWIGVLSAAGLGAVVSILLAISTGLPEAPREEDPDGMD